MKSLNLAFGVALVGFLIAGCATGGGGVAAHHTSGGGGTDERLMEIQRAIEAQSREIAELRAALASQDKRVQSDVEQINSSLDTHLELLDLLYRQLGQTSGAELPKAAKKRTSASVFGTAAIDQKSGESSALTHMRVFLLKEGAATTWQALASPRSLYNTPIQNAGTILTALEFKGDVKVSADETLNKARSPIALNSHLRTFEESLETLQIRPEVSTLGTGNYFFGDVAPGSYQVYARISPATYSVCWLVPVTVEAGSANEVNLDAANARVFLNDQEDSGR